MRWQGEEEGCDQVPLECWTADRGEEGEGERAGVALCSSAGGRERKGGKEGMGTGEIGRD